MAVEVSSTEFTIPLPYTTDRRGAVRWVVSHLLHQWQAVLLGLFAALGNALLYAVTPILLGEAFNALVAQPPRVDKLLQTALIIAGTQLLRGILHLGRNVGFELAAQRVERDIRNELYVSLLGKSMTFHSLQPVGDTMARATNDVREINYLFSPGLNLVSGSLYFLFVPLFLAPRYAPELMLTPALFAVFYGLALWRYLGELRPITDRVRVAFGRLNTRLSESLDGIEIVKGAAQEKGEISLFGTNAVQYKKEIVSEGDVEARFFPLLVFYIALGAGLFHALLLFHNGRITIGDVVAYYGLLLMLDFPTFISRFAYSQISLGLAGARRILELLNREDNLDQNIQGHAAEMHGEVEFREVSFAYDDTSVLEKISFKAKPGQMVAIVGQTGSGKTSLIKLINRIYDITSGSVLVDGVDVRDWNLESLRKNISIIEQDIFLFGKSIAENIAFGKENVGQEQIEEAARAAQAHDFILTFQDGYKTIVGERGMTLSGGQRQRIALARAFLTDPKILVLDDSTSAIDSATEDKIQRAIHRAAQGRTTFIITHRLSQIRWADIILVLRKGKLAAVGTHDELMKSSPIYQRIFSE